MNRHCPNRPNSAAVLLTATFEALALTGCHRDQPSNNQAGYVPPKTVATPTKHTQAGFQGRLDMYTYPDGTKIPVLHFNIELAPPNPEQFQRFLEIDPERPGKIVTDSKNPWADQKTWAIYNCHAFALGESVGITQNDLLNGAKVEYLKLPNPTQQLLNSFFTFKMKFEGPTLDSGFVTVTTGIVEGDVILFADGTGADTEYIHSGRIVKVDGENWVMSKIGEDPLVLTPAYNLFIMYDKTFSRIEIWGRGKN